MSKIQKRIELEQKCKDTKKQIAKKDHEVSLQKRRVSALRKIFLRLGEISQKIKNLQKTQSINKEYN